MQNEHVFFETVSLSDFSVVYKTQSICGLTPWDFEIIFFCKNLTLFNTIFCNLQFFSSQNFQQVQNTLTENANKRQKSQKRADFLFLLVFFANLSKIGQKMVKIGHFMQIFDPPKMAIFLMVPFFGDFFSEIAKSEKTPFQHFSYTTPLMVWKITFTL